MSSPLFMRDVSLKLTLVGPPAGTAAEYNCDVNTAAIESEAGDEVTYETLCAEGSYQSVGRTTFALHIVAAQKWAADGLATFLWANDGALATFTYQAHGEAVVPSADTPGMSGEVRLIAGAYGGAAGEYAELDVTLPCTSKPTMHTAAFPAALEAEAATEAA